MVIVQLIASCFSLFLNHFVMAKKECMMMLMCVCVCICVCQNCECMKEQIMSSYFKSINILNYILNYVNVLHFQLFIYLNSSTHYSSNLGAWPKPTLGLVKVEKIARLLLYFFASCFPTGALLVCLP